MNGTESEDKISLRELIDNISILANKKDFHAQVQHFPEEAASETIIRGRKNANSILTHLLPKQ